MDVSVNIRELDKSIGKTIDVLGRKIAKHLGKKAVLDIILDRSEVIKSAMVENAPRSNKVKIKKELKTRTHIVLPGTLKRSMTIFPGEDGMSAYVGPRRKGAKKGDKTANGFYGYWNNYGLGIGRRTPSQFREKAYLQKGQTVANAIIRDLEKKVKLINREVRGTGS